MAPQILLGGGGSNAFGPPDFKKNSIMYTINVQYFSLNKQWNAYIIMYILLKNFKTSKFFLKTFKIVNKNFEISSIFSILFSQNTLTFLIYSKCLTFHKKNLKVNKIMSIFLQILHYTKTFLKVSNNFLEFFK